MKEIAASLALVILAVGSAGAQELEPWHDAWLYVSAAGFYDSNVDHALDPTDDHSLALGAGLFVREEADRWNAEFQYEFARHRYRRSERWDRDSHHARFTLDAQLTPRWKIEFSGEGSLKGSAEDRELVDTAFGSAGISFDPVPTTRLRLTGAWRHRWFREPEEAESRNPYVDLGLRQRLGNAWSFGIGPRWEIRRDDDPRNDYRRWTYTAQLVGRYGLRRAVQFALRYRDKRYEERVIELEENHEEQRRDLEWIPSLRWTHRLFGGVELELDYRYETRRSNDPDRAFDAHLVSLATRANF